MWAVHLFQPSLRTPAIRMPAAHAGILRSAEWCGSDVAISVHLPTAYLAGCAWLARSPHSSATSFSLTLLAHEDNNRFRRSFRGVGGNREGAPVRWAETSTALRLGGYGPEASLGLKPSMLSESAAHSVRIRSPVDLTSNSRWAWNRLVRQPSARRSIWSISTLEGIRRGAGCGWRRGRPAPSGRQSRCKEMPVVVRRGKRSATGLEQFPGSSGPVSPVVVVDHPHRPGVHRSVIACISVGGYPSLEAAGSPSDDARLPEVGDAVRRRIFLGARAAG